MLAAVGAVEPIVGAHHRPGLRLPHRDLEAAQIDFPQRALVDDGVHEHAPVLLVVDGKVLHAGTHALTLHAVDQGGGQLSAEQRVLGEVLEVPPAQRVTLDVHARAEQHGHPFGDAFLTQGHPDLPQQLPVPGARQGRCGGKAGGRHAGIEARVIGLGILLAQTVGAVGHHHRGQPQPRHRLQMPEVPARAEPGLLFQGHLGDQRGRLVVLGLQPFRHDAPPIERARG